MNLLTYCRMIALLLCLILNANAVTIKAQRWLTQNKVPVVFYQAMEVPMLDVNLAFAAGSAYDGNRYGLSALTCNMMNQGNAHQNASTMAEALADLGAQYSADSTRDMAVFKLRTLTRSDNLEKSSRIFSQIIHQPDFPEQALQREKMQLLTALKQAQESPAEVADSQFFKLLYKDHPYAHAVDGSVESIHALTQEQLIDFYKQYYVANNAYLVIVGAIDSQKAHQLAEQFTQGLAQGKTAPLIPDALQPLHTEQKIIPFPSSQTMLRIGQLGIDHHNPHYFPLMVGNYILGGATFDSRLNHEVREKRGLTYGVNSQFVPMAGHGPFLISLSTQNDSAAAALKITQDTLQQFITKGPSEQELQAAKQYIIGSFPIALDSNEAIITLLLHMAFYHLPEDYLEHYLEHIKAVTLNEIKQAFKQQLNLNQLVLVTVGKT